MDLETKNDQGSVRRGVEEEELFNQREDQEVGDEKEKEHKTVPETELKVTVTEEEEQVKLDSRLGPEQAQELQLEDGLENNNEAITDKQKDKERMCLEEKKKTRKRRGKKQSEQMKNRRGLKDTGEKFEEKIRSRTQEVSVLSPEESSALPEPPVGLMNSCDLSDPGGAGLYYPPVPVPLLYSQPPVPIQPVPPQPHGTKRPHSPLLPHGLTHQVAQPLEVRMEGNMDFSDFIHCTLFTVHC